ncbi:6703_t:CDS:2, partial [Gigaspora margarita]
MLIWELVFEKLSCEDISDMNQMIEHIINDNRKKIKTTPESQNLDESKLNKQLPITESNETSITEIKSLEKASLNIRIKVMKRPGKEITWKARYLADCIFVNKDMTQAAVDLRKSLNDKRS